MVGEVVDSLGSASYAQQTVTVLGEYDGDVALSLESYLISSVDSAFSSNNIDSVVQTVNTVASAISQVS